MIAVALNTALVALGAFLAGVGSALSGVAAYRKRNGKPRD